MYIHTTRVRQLGDRTVRLCRQEVRVYRTTQHRFFTTKFMCIPGTAVQQAKDKISTVHTDVEKKKKGNHLSSFLEVGLPRPISNPSWVQTEVQASAHSKQPKISCCLFERFRRLIFISFYTPNFLSKNQDCCMEPKTYISPCPPESHLRQAFLLWCLLQYCCVF